MESDILISLYTVVQIAIHVAFPLAIGVIYLVDKRVYFMDLVETYAVVQGTVHVLILLGFISAKLLEKLL